MTKAVSFEEALKRLLEKHGGNIILLEYTKMKDKNKFECIICGNRWYAKGDNIIGSGQGCPKCYEKRRGDYYRLSQEDVENYILSIGCKWISGEYKTNKSKLEILFECGHSTIITYNKLTSGKRCQICGKINGYKKKRNSESKIISAIESHGFSFIDFPNNYEGIHSLIRYSCNLGHITERQYFHFHLHPNCATCMEETISEKYRLTHEDICKSIESKNCILISDEGYKNRNSFVIVLFSCGHEEKLKMSTFLAKTENVCRKCSSIFYKGKNSQAWKNGMSATLMYLRGLIGDWYKKSLEIVNYKCVLTGLSAQTVHHIMPFNKICQQVFDNLNLEVKEKICEYSDENLILITEEFIKLHNSYGYGAPLTKNAHLYFHKRWGHKNFTPENFEEFKNLYFSDQIQL